MDAIDILGGLFGRKRGGSGKGKGPDLGEIFGRGKRSSPERRGGPASRSTSPQDVDRQADELEDLLNVAHKRDANRRSNPAPSTPAPSSSPRRRTPSDGGIPVDSPFSRRRDTASTQDEQALVLVRAMVNAAKADGQISSAEQKSIIQHFDGSSADAMQFLRDELSRPLDVREFAWSVPLGMEQQVYAMSLIAIDVDSPAETEYLEQLAHALRIPSEVREHLQRRYRSNIDR